MKKVFKVMTALCLALIMSCAIVPVAAEKVVSEEDSKIVLITEDNDTKAYELVWKYKKENGHLYKRRWNKTLNAWYDPAWILVN